MRGVLTVCVIAEWNDRDDHLLAVLRTEIHVAKSRNRKSIGIASRRSGDDDSVVCANVGDARDLMAHGILLNSQYAVMAVLQRPITGPAMLPANAVIISPTLNRSMRPK